MIGSTLEAPNGKGASNERVVTRHGSQHPPGVAAYIAFIVLIGASIVAIGIRIAGRGRGRDDSGNLLRERFARGEITATEYEDARRILGL
jgi:YD repeat-containing protein